MQPGRAPRAAVALLLLVAPPWAAAATIRNSAHDLSSTSTAAVRSTDDQICKFCHTPHKAFQTALVWNHSPTANGTYSWGGPAATTSGTTLATALKPASKACMGCHDGTIAIGNLANAGGGAAGTIAFPDVANRISGGMLVAANKNRVGNGGNLQGNHPVSIPYAGQTGYNGINSAVPSSKVDGAPGNYWPVKTTGCANATGICTTANATGTNGAVIQLYDNAAGTKTNIGLECDTCHEPHNRYGFQWLMRVDAATSDGLCRSCHNK